MNYATNIPLDGVNPGFMAGLGFGFIGFIIIIAIWSLVWKGLAMWKSARKGEKVWFVIFLIVNTAGILEIIYLLMNREPNTTSTAQVPPPANPQA